MSDTSDTNNHSGHHGHDHRHDHDHSHDAQDASTLSIQIANQVINVANTRMEEGLPTEVIAAGLRHAAANFSAFSHFREAALTGSQPGGDAELSAIVEDFLGMFEYYLDRHAPQAAPEDQAGAGLQGLINQAKNEI